MNQETKVLGIIGAITLLLVVGGAVLFSKSSPTEPSSSIDPSQLISEDAPYRGSREAKVTIVEFSDYQCPACKAAHADVERVVSEYGDKIMFMYRQFPLQSHRNSKPAAFAALAAGKQNMYWEMHNKLFETQEEWADIANPRDKFTDFASNLGMDRDKFRADMDSNEIFDLVNKEVEAGFKVGISATPTFFINGQKFSGVLTYSQMKNIIDPLLASE